MKIILGMLLAGLLVTFSTPAPLVPAEPTILLGHDHIDPYDFEGRSRFAIACRMEHGLIEGESCQVYGCLDKTRILVHDEQAPFKYWCRTSGGQL